MTAEVTDEDVQRFAFATGVSVNGEGVERVRAGLAAVLTARQTEIADQMVERAARAMNPGDWWDSNDGALAENHRDHWRGVARRILVAALSSSPVGQENETEHIRSNPGHIVVRNSGQPAWCSKRGCGWKEAPNV